MLEIRKKLEEEITALEYELRNELPREILRARAHGDLSENAEYHAAKERQGMVNARLGQLQKRLSELSMIDTTKIPHDKVGAGIEGGRARYEERRKVHLLPSDQRGSRRTHRQDLDRFSRSGGRCWARKWATP